MQQLGIDFYFKPLKCILPLLSHKINSPSSYILTILDYQVFLFFNESSLTGVVSQGYNLKLRLEEMI